MILIFRVAIIFAIPVVPLVVDTDKFTCSRFSQCMCSRTAGKISVFCEIFDNVEILPQLFQDLGYNATRYLKLKNCTAKSLPDNLFINTSIDALGTFCPFENLDDNSLVTIQSLEFLHMAFTKFEKIPRAISKLRKLRSLTLVDGLLNYVGEELQNITYLQNLYLRGNQIEVMERDAFTSNVHLQLIDISRNGIKVLPSGIFRVCQFLQTFIVSHNMLQSTEGIPKGLQLKVS